MFASRTSCVYEGIHHPELDVFNVGCLKICCLQRTHHTAPVLFGILQFAVDVKVGIKVVRTSFVGIVCEIEDVQGRGLADSQFLVREQLCAVYFSHIMVTQLIEVALNVSWG